jgi:YVTN family beta-propeller protein
VVGALLAVLLVLPHPVATIPTGQAPCGAAAGFGAVWVANDGSGTLTRVDPRTNRVTRRVSVGRGACSVAVGAGAVWVVNYAAGSLTRVVPRTQARRSVRVGGAPFDVLVAFGRVWVTAWEDGILDEIDPESLGIVRRIEIGPRPMGLAARLGALWVGFGREATEIARVDPRTRLVTRYPVGAARPGWFAAGTPDLWIQAADSDLLHVDPRNGQVLKRLHVGATLGQGALAPDGTLWVPDKETNLVYRIDPDRQRVRDSFAAGPGAYLVLRAFGSMWVLSYAGSDVRRFRGS